MKLADINVAVGILSGMKLFRISDKKTRTALVNNYGELRPHFKKVNEDASEIRTKFQQDWNEELDAVQAFRDKGVRVVGHDEYLEAEAGANKAISDLFLADVEVDIIPVAKNDFLANCAGVADDLTMEQLFFLEDCGIIVP